MQKRQTKSAPKARPRLITIVACDGAARDPNSGKATLYGVFDNIRTPEFPATVAISVYAKLADGNGKHVITVDVLDPRGKSVVLHTPSLDVDCVKGNRRELCVIGLPIKLTRTGTHRLRFTIDGKPLGSDYDIDVVQIPKKESPE